MGFEVRYIYHPRKEDGGYNMEIKEDKIVKVGKPFDDTPLEKCAAAIMAQLARRDIWVNDVQVSELVKKEISFKTSKDGHGIILKNKKFSLSQTAELVSEEEVQTAQSQELVVQQPHELAVQPHELVRSQAGTELDQLYADPNRAVPMKKAPSLPVNQNRILYQVWFDPEIAYIPEAKRLKLKFSPDKKYPVHAIVPHPTGNLQLQKIVVTDDTGKAITVEEKFFTSAGRGLYGDRELNFSGNGERKPKRKLLYEDQMQIDVQDVRQHHPDIPQGIPLDDGSVPEELLAVPNVRPGKKF